MSKWLALYRERQASKSGALSIHTRTGHLLPGAWITWGSAKMGKIVMAPENGWVVVRMCPDPDTLVFVRLDREVYLLSSQAFDKRGD